MKITVLNDRVILNVDNDDILNGKNSLEKIIIYEETTSREFEVFKKEGAFELIAEELRKVYDGEEKFRGSIKWSTGERVKIVGSDFSLDDSVRSYVSSEGITFAVFPNLQDELEFFWNENPSVRSYNYAPEIVKFEQKENLLSIEVSIDSRYFEIRGAMLRVANRYNKNDFFLEEEHKVMERMEGRYSHVFSFELDILELQEILSGQYLDEVNPDVVDLSILPRVAEINNNKESMRIKYSRLFADENWFDFDGKKLLLRNYRTADEEFSFRVFFLESEAYFEYEKQKMETLSNDRAERIIGNENKVHKGKDDVQTILICETLTSAQDNGLEMFKYLLEKADPGVRVFYMIGKDSPEIQNLYDYREHVVYYKSAGHIRALAEADVLLHTHSSGYIIPFYTNVTEEWRKQIKKVFLQHGITLLKSIDNTYSNRGDFTNKFIVCSKRERKLVVENLGFSADNVLITGLARFDQLLANKSSWGSWKLRKKILIMPTWRRSDINKSHEEFLKTDFYKQWRELLTSDEFEKICRDEKLQVTFYLHRAFDKFRELFKSDFVDIIKEEDLKIIDLLKQNGNLITDYSSVSLDFILLERRVIQYRFDKNNQESSKESLKTDFGRIVHDQKDLFNILRKNIKNNLISKSEKKKAQEELYNEFDRGARKRIYDEIKNLRRN